jgi:hypothetical protein
MWRLGRGAVGEANRRSRVGGIKVSASHKGWRYLQDNEVISASEMPSAENRVAMGRARPVSAVSPSWTGCVVWSAAESRVARRGATR